MKLLNLVAAAAIVFAVSSEASAQKINYDLLASSTPLNNSLDNITKLEPVSFEYSKANKELNLTSGLTYGFKADEVQEVFPSIVKTTHKMVPAGKNAFKTVSTKTVDLESLIPLLVGSIKEQQAEIEKLKAEMATLKQEIKK